MKEIIKKIIIYIDGKEFITESCDFSESIADYEKECDCMLDDQEILEYIDESDD